MCAIGGGRPLNLVTVESRLHVATVFVKVEGV